MLYTPVNTFKGVITNMTGRPAAAWGTACASDQNTFPAFTEILPDTAYDTFGIMISLNSGLYAGEARDYLVKIGIDHSGATTYTNCTIPNLLATNAGAINNTGVWYYFPLYIPAGSALAASVSCSHATDRNMYVGVSLFGRPTHPELVRAGSYVDSFGAVTAASDGTTITSGTTDEGAWTEVTGASVTTKPYWWWQSGWGAADSSLTAVIYGMDVAVGSAAAKEIIFQDQLKYNAGTAEQSAQSFLPCHCHVAEVATGVLIYSRFQCSGTVDSNLSTIVYALGG